MFQSLSAAKLCEAMVFIVVAAAHAAYAQDQPPFAKPAQDSRVQDSTLQAVPSQEAPRVQQQAVDKSPLKVELRETAEQSTFAVLGVERLDALRSFDEAQLQELFVVRVQSTDSTALPPVLGSYLVTAAEIQFVSRFPLSSAVRYRVELAEQLVGGEARVLEFSPARHPLAAAPQVVAIYPTSDVLPENLLKFYIHFSAPMSRGEAYKRIHLLQAGVEVSDPFLELGEELWDTDQTRFTLFIHPGRIKRGVKPREDSGLPMTEGKSYTLRIDEQWQGADRQPLLSTHLKEFRVVAADEEQPNPERWKIGTPKANTRQPLTLTFNEPLDHAMLNRVLKVRHSSGELIPGQVAVAEHETVWSFEPTRPWKRTVYAIEVATNLEDLAGNSIARPFETKMQIAEEVEFVAPQVAIEFSVD